MQLCTNHGLKQLWLLFKAVSVEVEALLDDPGMPKHDINGIESYIDQLHVIDAGSFAFRYPRTKTGADSIVNVKSQRQAN